MSLPQERKSLNLIEELRPFVRESVSGSILNLIIDYVISGQLRPGDKLPTEMEFVAKLGVGRNSVREALKVLCALGIILVKRGSGTFVAESMSNAVLEPLILSLAIDQPTPKALIELRLLIETGIADLVIDKATDDDLRELEKANSRLREAGVLQKTDHQKLRDLDLDVHFTLFRLTRSPFVEKIAKAIYRLFYASIERTVEIDPQQAYRNHELMLEAIKRRDKALTRVRIREALSFWMDYIDKQQL